ncbi:MAG: PQQ-binding-like beta-propeller repeat protein [Acidobacteria bacterium]|nr:PQQ-binding-like beta-propeller repeat protein [Acidobacteriota bacterium]
MLNRDELAKATLIALDRRTGKEVWRFVNNVNPRGPGGQSYATPVLWKETSCCIGGTRLSLTALRTAPASGG